MTRMKCSEYARHRGVSRVAVAKAIKTRQLDGSAIGFTKRGKRRVPFIKDVNRADVLWASRPQSKPAPVSSGAGGSPPPVEAVRLGDSPGPIEASRRALEHFRALQTKLDYERAAGKLIDVEAAIEIFGRVVRGAQIAFRGLGNKLRNRVPSDASPADVVADVELLVHEILTELAASASDASCIAANPERQTTTGENHS